jgi:hypothetical protein
MFQKELFQSFRTMQNDKTNPTAPSRVPSVAETTARLEREEAEQDARMQETTPKNVESIASKASMQNSSSVEEEARESDSKEQTIGSDGRPLFEPERLYFPTDSRETDERAKRVLSDLQREQKSRVQNPSLLLDDLRELVELGMYGELSDDNCHVNMPFEDVHRLVTTMRMAELLLNDRVQTSRKEKWQKSKLNQLDAEH